MSSRWHDFKESIDTTIWRKEFKCWVVHGHVWDKTGTRMKATMTMNECRLCGKVEAGSDGWN